MNWKTFIAAAMMLAFFRSAVADWNEPVQVNVGTEGIQGCRDTDTPWAIAADDSGNVHFVFESDDVFNDHRLDIHYRVKKRDGTWGNEETVTAAEVISHDAFGHTSIIMDEYSLGLVCYIMDAAFQSNAPEMRTREFEF